MRRTRSPAVDAGRRTKAPRSDRSPPARRPRPASLALVWAFALVVAGVVAPASVAAQDTLLMRAYTLEQDGKFGEAAVAYRAALTGSEVVAALLGLERTWAAVGATDSLLPVLDSLIRAQPRETAFRSAQFRTLQTMGRQDALDDAFAQWVRDMPREPSPYREYSRLLLQAGRVTAADSVLQRARAALGAASDRDLAYETAQLHAASGAWLPSSEAWRVALRPMPYLQQAAIFALVRAPDESRADIRRVLAAPPTENAARVVLSALELGWGEPGRGWEALSVLPRGDSSIKAWTDFATRAEEAGAWLVARDALAAVNEAKPSIAIALRAGTAALNGGDAASALALVERAVQASDSASATTAVALMVRSLGMLGRAADADRLAREYAGRLTQAQQSVLAREVAWAWIRVGDLARARDALASVDGAAEGEAAGWVALYGGDLRTARDALRRTRDATSGAVAALALIMRTRADSAPGLGEAFLLLARGDTTAAASAFADARRELPDAAAILLATAARLHAARADDHRAEGVWRTIVEEYQAAPEAAEADLEWARILRRRGDAPGAITRLEHLILTYPSSALVPQARRELELARNRIPGTA